MKGKIVCITLLFWNLNYASDARKNGTLYNKVVQAHNDVKVARKQLQRALDNELPQGALDALEQRVNDTLVAYRKIKAERTRD